MADGSGMDHFLIFLSPCGLPRGMAVALTFFWSLLSLRGPSASDGDSMDHFMFVSVAVRSFHSRW